MKKLAICLALTCSILTLTGCKDDPVKIAKDTILPYMPGMSIGAALNHYSVCKPGTQEWSTFTSKQTNKQIVDFKCTDEYFPDRVKNLKNVYIKDAKSSLNKDDLEKNLNAFDITKATFILRLRQMDNDKKSYELHLIGHRFEYADGTKGVTEWKWKRDLLKEVYNDKDFASYIGNRLHPLFFGYHMVGTYKAGSKK